MRERKKVINTQCEDVVIDVYKVQKEYRSEKHSHESYVVAESQIFNRFLKIFFKDALKKSYRKIHFTT